MSRDDDLAMPCVPMPMPAMTQGEAWLPPKAMTMMPMGEHLEPGVPEIHAEPEEVGIEEFLQAQQKPATPVPSMPVREILNRTMLADALNELAHRVDDDMDQSCAKLHAAATAITEAVQGQLDAAVALAQADVRGVMLEAAEQMGEVAGKIAMQVLAEEVGKFAAEVSEHVDTMKTAAHNMRQAAAEGPSAPSRLVWLVTGAVGFWFVTKYVDLARWTAIGDTVIKTLKGAL